MPAAQNRRLAAFIVLSLSAALATLAGRAGPAAAGLSDSPTPPSPTPTATPVDGPGLCTVGGEHRVGTTSMEIGQALGMALTLRASCPESVKGKADILLVVDYSASMLEQGKFDAAQGAVRQFLDNVDFSLHRVGLVPFSNSAYVAQPLTQNRDYLDLALKNSGGPVGGTNIGEAIATADREMYSTGRRDAVWIIVLLTDGQSAVDPMRRAAAQARDRGMVLFTIGLGQDVAEAELKAIATTPAHYHFAPDAAALTQIYLDIAAMIRAVTVTDIVLVDRLGQVAQYLPGSGLPREPEIPGEGRDLRWRIPFLAGNQVLYSFNVRLQSGGIVEPSEIAWADYTDGDGIRRRYVFPSPKVEVRVPERRYAFLPFLARNHCLPATQRSDVVLALDNSSSMSGPKLQGAVAAARRFIGLLSLPLDRAALVAYAGEAQVLAGLTGDPDTLEAALLALRTGSGTRIDLGLQQAGALLTGRADPQRRPAIVLLTDGRQSAPGDVLGIARGLRARGIAIYTVAFGGDADTALLGAIAGRPDRVFVAEDAGALAEIYAELAATVSCR
jgi:Mg-chelatase subunit ChlD